MDLIEGLGEYLFDGRYDRDHADLPKLLSTPAHAPRRGLSWMDGARQSYANMRDLAAATGPPSSVNGDVHRLCALHEWMGVVDPAAVGIMSVHYNLCAASLANLAQRPQDVADLLADVDSMRAIGLFLATETTSGNNLAAIRTRATYDAATDEFVLDSPDHTAYKIMSTTGLPGLARVGVVIARLDMPGVEPALHAFAVRLTTESGLAPGVRVIPLSRGITMDMDYALTGFHGVRVARRHWLPGPGADADPRTTRPGFWQTLDCLKLGRMLLAGAALAEARAALAITVRHSLHRMTQGGRGRQVPAMAHRNHNDVLIRLIGRAYAATGLVNTAKNLWAEGVAEPHRTLVVNTVKVLASYTALDTSSRCRERCGAQGLLLHNRIAEYLGLAHAAVTAEGDNQVLALAIAKQLIADQRFTTRSCPTPIEVPDLLAFRTRALLDQARKIVADPARTDPFDAWNAATGHARDAVLAHCEEQAHLSLLAGAANADGPAHTVLAVLARHHGTALVLEHADRYLVHGLLDPARWHELTAQADADRLVLVEHAEALVDAFGYTPELLATAIGNHTADKENTPC
ncbi:acyl-CoA dehydrogenase family protein [Saccharothrix xinjiangensis]|uniref:Acyl-CoA dehydrogenase family protein n=1 Tax=Saccharothrix xinjiangensis TaxID=204798 RepID=A0ABV9Y2Q6_9PSEU